MSGRGKEVTLTSTTMDSATVTVRQTGVQASRPSISEELHPVRRHMGLTKWAIIRFVFKCVELALACICMGLYSHSIFSNYALSAPILLPITYGGFIIILCGLLLGYVTNERVPLLVDILYTFTGFALFIAAGSIGINYFRPRSIDDSPPELLLRDQQYISIGLASGSIAIINGGVFLADLACGYKEYLIDTN